MPAATTSAARCARSKENQDEAFDLLAARAERRRASSPPRSSACARRSFRNCSARARAPTTSPAATGGAPRSPIIPMAGPTNGTLDIAGQHHRRRPQSLRAARLRARHPEDRGGRRHRCRDRRPADRPDLRHAAGQGRAAPVARCHAAGPRPPHRHRPRRAADRRDLRRTRASRATIPTSWPPISSTTSSAAARSPRGSIKEVREKRGLAYGVYN